MNRQQVYFEDVVEGTEIRGLSFGPVTLTDLVRFGCATGNFHPIHFDRDVAKREGHPDVLVHGPLKLALLDRMIRDWIGEYGRLRKITCSYKAMDLPGNTLHCKGRVVGSFCEANVGRIECEVWLENQQGEVTTSGTVVVELPLRQGCGDARV